MTIEFECPHCGTVLKTADERAGLTAKCPSCAEQIHVPYQKGSLYGAEAGAGEVSNLASDPYQSEQEPNPYATPVGSRAYADDEEYDALPLAGRGARFAAFLIDTVVSLLAAAPGFAIMLVGENNDGAQLLGVLVMLAGVLGISIFQWVLLTRDGQTIGKKALRIRIVDYSYGTPLGFGRVVGMRIWLNGTDRGCPVHWKLLWTRRCPLHFRTGTALRSRLTGQFQSR